jgi:hypothetical protein
MYNACEIAFLPKMSFQSGIFLKSAKNSGASRSRGISMSIAQFFKQKSSWASQQVCWLARH